LAWSPFRLASAVLQYARALSVTSFWKRLGEVIEKLMHISTLLSSRLRIDSRY
jgi:hypothetical protein